MECGLFLEPAYVQLLSAFLTLCMPLSRLASERTLKEHDRAVLANAVNQWRGMRDASIPTQGSRHRNSPSAHQQRHVWTSESDSRLRLLAMEDSSTDDSSSLCIRAQRVATRSEVGGGSENAESVGTSEELSLADLPVPGTSRWVPSPLKPS